MSTNASTTEPMLIQGGLIADDRGALSFVNDFGFEAVRRFYLVENHESGFVRAWHGHQREAKAVFVVSGAAIVGAVKVTDWKAPDPNAKVARFVLDSRRPSVLLIPAGYANGFKTLQPGTKVMFFSSSTLEESAGDDIRLPARFWNCWSIEER